MNNKELNELSGKKFKEKSKNDIYSFIKESINVSMSPLKNKYSSIENVDVSIKGMEELVEKINNYVDSEKIKSKMETLISIKNDISTGVLSLKKINEELEACACSETCPDVSMFFNDDEKEKENGQSPEFDDNYYEDSADSEDDEIIDTGLSNERVSLSDEFIKLIESGEYINMDWDAFFDKYNVNQQKRTESLINSIVRDAVNKNPNLF